MVGAVIEDTIDRAGVGAVRRQGRVKALAELRPIDMVGRAGVPGHRREQTGDRWRGKRATDHGEDRAGAQPTPDHRIRF